VKSIPSYVQRSLFTILRIFMTYKPLRFFMILGSIPFSIGMLLGIRWVVLFVLEAGTRSRAPSLILAAILILIGFQIWMFSLVADLLAVNRKVLEDIQLRLRRADLDSHKRKMP
jgi:hypothetical protein